MTPTEFYQDAVTEQIKRLDAIGSDLEMVYSSLDLAYEAGNPTEGAEATARLLEEDEERETERLEFFVAKLAEYSK
jgi:hypothetical protein